MTTHNEGETESVSRWRWRFWDDINDEVRHLEIDYNTREREKQITKIVNDGGFKIRVFFVAASGFLASSYSLFAVDILSIALFKVYPPEGRLGGDPGLVIDELTLTGTILGMLLMGHLADRSGRKKWYGAELAVLLVATMGMVHLFQYPLSSIITAEWASTESRGVMLSAVFSMQSLGRLLSFAVSLGALRNLRGDARDEDQMLLAVDKVWRWTVGVALIPAAIAILLRLTIPETPRFYASIMKDSRKGVLNAMRLYGRNKNIQEMNSDTDSSLRDRGAREEPWYTWYKTAWKYLTGPKQGWKPLFVISLLWAIMDIPWYGLTMDLSSALATLIHVSGSGDECGHALHYFSGASETSNITCNISGREKWNKDYWNNNNTISDMIEQNAMRSIVIVCIASILGSIGSIVIIDFFRRKIILIATFFVIIILLAITGGTLITSQPNEPHMAAIVCYAILQFVFNLGPNTLIFVLASEIFPTTYRGTFNGIVAGSGKVGAVIIRVIIAKTKSCAIYTEGGSYREQTEERVSTDAGQIPATRLQNEPQPSDAVSETSSTNSSASSPAPADTEHKIGLL
ncbi:Inorganic phosphate transporter PHO84, partial [Fusarium albosuccineum]